MQLGTRKENNMQRTCKNGPKTKCVRFEAYIFLAYTKRTMMNRESERITRDAPVRDRVTNSVEDVTRFGKKEGTGYYTTV